MKRNISIRNFILAGLLLFAFQGAVAQQVPLLNNFYRNPYLFNPGYSRNDSIADVMAVYRNQWAGIQGAPETHLLSVNGLTVRKNWNFGGLFINDVSNITKRTSAYISSSYLIQLSSEQNLRLGISVGALQNRIDFERVKAQDVTEPTLIAASDVRTAFDGNAGLYYNFNQIEAGVSALHLFNSRLNYSNTSFDEQAGFQLLRHYFIFLKYRHLFEAANFRFSPLAMIRSTQSLPVGWDIGGIVEYKDLLFFSPVYKSNYGLALNLGIHLNKFLNVAYAYEIPFNGIGPYSKGTHEFALQCTFRTGERRAVRGIQPVQLPVPTEEKAVAKEDRKSRKDKHYEDSHFHDLEQKLDSLQTRMEGLAKHEAEHLHKIDSLERHDREMSEKVAKNQFDLEITRDELRKLEERIHQNLSEKHTFFEEDHVHKDSLEEFDTNYWDYFIVTGSYHDMNAAKFMIRTLKSDYNIDAKIVTNQNQPGTYNVVTKQVFSRDEAVAEISELDLKVKKQLMPQGARLFQVRK